MATEINAGPVVAGTTVAGHLTEAIPVRWWVSG
jgi:hypothetical protein